MKETTTHAQAAKLIRQDLKKVFPSTKFEVRSSSFAGGNSVDIRWNNGPTDNQVDEVVGKYQYGSFDSMQDLYEHTNRRKDIPQVKFVQTSRTVEKEIYQFLFEKMKLHYSGWENLEYVDEYDKDFQAQWSHPTPMAFIDRRMHKIDLTNLEGDTILQAIMNA
jgi:hypothetical protein